MSSGPHPDAKYRLSAGKAPIPIAEGFESFSDPAYYDMICLRRVGDKDFNETIHFTNTDQAHHASHVIAKWINEG